MGPQTIGILGIAVLLLFMALGMHIGFAMFVVGSGGLFFLISTKAVMSTIATEPYTSLANYTLTTIPMFALMGYFAFYAGMTGDLFVAARKWTGKLPGGLAIAGVAGCTAFAFCSGSSLASAAVMGKVVVPELLRHGYDKRLATGTIAASGTLASLIPPSIILILFGVITEQSIAKLLVGGIIPGLLSAAIYMVGIVIVVLLKPSLAPHAIGVTWKERFVALKGVWGIAALALLVMGGIYTGLFSPTEAGAAGAMGALLIGLFTRRINRRNFWAPFADGAMLTSQIFLIIAGALMFARFLTFSRLPYFFVKWVLALPVSPIVILVGIMAAYIVLGTFMEPLGMMFITLPVIYPAVVALGFNPIWFAILLVKTVEIGLITPPVGMNVYTLNSACQEVSLEDIFRGCGMFLVMDILTLALLIAVPSIVTYLPNLMK